MELVMISGEEKCFNFYNEKVSTTLREHLDTKLAFISDEETFNLYREKVFTTWRGHLNTELALIRVEDTRRKFLLPVGSMKLRKVTSTSIERVSTTWEEHKVKKISFNFYKEKVSTTSKKHEVKNFKY